MNLKNYKFKEITMCMTTDPVLLEEAKKRNFYNGQTKYNALFSSLFFSGGKLDFKKNLDMELKQNALPYLKAFMGSFEPKHEEKEAISALLLSELVDIY